MRRLALATFLALILPSTAGLAVAQSPQEAKGTTGKIDFAQLADSYVTEYEARDAITLEDVLDGPHYARVTLGTLDLRYPVSYLRDGARAKQFKSIAETLCVFQGEWMKWKDIERDGYPQAVADLKAVSKWVHGWSTRALSKASGGDAGTLYDQLGAKDDVVEAATRLAAFLGPDEEAWLMLGDVNRMVFAPDRRHFLELVALAGYLNSNYRQYYWADSWAGQPAVWIDWTHVIALEDTPWPVDLDHPFQGADISARDSTLFDQRIVDRAAATMMRAYFYKNGAHFFESALNTNLVIATIGKNDLYVEDWSNEMSWTGSTTQGESRFVPGGNPQGGTLPKKSAGLGSVSADADTTPRWRKGGGENYFVADLRAGQKDGAKEAAKDKQNPLRDSKIANFQLLRVEDGSTAVVTAPFFGPDQDTKELPPLEFLDDYEEFFRAYRSAFMHWMQTEALNSEEESRIKFAQLIQKQASRSEDTPFVEVVEDVYGTPLSDGTPECFEQRFLVWLSKQK